MPNRFARLAEPNAVYSLRDTNVPRDHFMVFVIGVYLRATYCVCGRSKPRLAQFLNDKPQPAHARATE